MPVFTLGKGDDVFNPWTPTRLPDWSAYSVVFGGNGDDTIEATGQVGVVAYGGNGDDSLSIGGFRSPRGSAFGRDGDDTLIAVSSSGHTLDGGRGDDLLVSHSTAIGGGFWTDQGAYMTGGPGHDTFVLDSRAEVYVFNNPDGTLSEGDAVTGIIDVVADYEAGELLDLPSTPARGQVGTSGSTAGPDYLNTSDGGYGILRGALAGPGRFTVAADGDDLLIVYQADGDAAGQVGGAVAVLGGAHSELLIG
jgi:hypothetical protein